MPINDYPIVEAEEILNLTGLRCPEPVMLLRKKLRDMAPQQTVMVIADDPATTRDVPIFCHFMAHKLLFCHKSSTPYRYLICKSGNGYLESEISGELGNC